MPHSRRRQLHSRIAATLEGKFPEIVTAQPALLAHHCAEAGLDQKAVEYWLKAGRQAVTRSAMTEAEGQLNRGLDLLCSLPADDWRWQHELDLLAALGPALIATKGYSAPDIGKTFARAKTLAEQLNQPAYLLGLLYGQWAYRVVRSEHKLALSFAQELEQIGEATRDVAALLLGQSVHGFTHFNLGELVAARALLARCHGMSDPAHRAVYTPR